MVARCRGFSIRRLAILDSFGSISPHPCVVLENDIHRSPENRMLKWFKDLVDKRSPPLTVEQVLSSKLSYLSQEKLQNIQDQVRQVQFNNVPGLFIEYGVALGGSSIFIASHLKRNRQFVGYDLFGTIPPPGPNDDEKSHKRYEVIHGGKSRGIGGDKYYGYEENLLEKVKASFMQHGFPVNDKQVKLVKGLFENTVKHPCGTEIAFAHIDCDWYDPVKLCLEQTAPYLQKGGVIMLDDYNDYGGCKRATDEFLSHHPTLHLVDNEHNAIIHKR